MNTTGIHSARPAWVFPAFMAAFYVLWSLRVVLLLPVDKGIANEWLRMGWSHGVRVALWIVPIVLYLKCVDGAGVLAFVKLRTRPRRAGLAAGIVAGYVLVVAMSACLFQGGRWGVFLEMTGARWASLLVNMAIIAVVEETFFRGFVYGKLRATRAVFPSVLLTSLLFLLIHWPGWLYLRGLHGNLIPLSAGIFSIAFVMGLLVEFTDSLWPAIALHFLNNVVSASLS